MDAITEQRAQAMQAELEIIRQRINALSQSTPPQSTPATSAPLDTPHVVAAPAPEREAAIARLADALTAPNVSIEDLLEAENQSYQTNPITRDEVLNYVNAGERADDFLMRPLPPKEPLIDEFLHCRDLVAIGARRRHGKTSLVMQMAIALANDSEFLGYTIPEPRRSLLILLEDDPRELQDKLRKQSAGRDLSKIAIYPRDYFEDQGIKIHLSNLQFKNKIYEVAQKFRPDMIVLDNLAHLISAKYTDPALIHDVFEFSRDLSRRHNAAVLIPAHPGKRDKEQIKKNSHLTLQSDPETFFESIMGSSHFINSMGSLWALERNGEITTFLAGRQRVDGTQQAVYLEMDDSKNFQLLTDARVNIALLLNTDKRRQAWSLLPTGEFGYKEGEAAVKSVMRSSDTYYQWMRELRRLKVVIDTPSGRLTKIDLPGQIR
jgi:hypothetical protein